MRDHEEIQTPGSPHALLLAGLALLGAHAVGALTFGVALLLVAAGLLL